MEATRRRERDTARAISQENVEVFKRSSEAWNGDDWQSFKVDAQIKGRFDDIRDLGDAVLALGELTGTGRTTGMDLIGEIAQLATFRDGKIVSFRDFASHAEALEAAGLRE